MRLDTADLAVVARLGQRTADVAQDGDDGLVIEIGRHADTGACDLRGGQLHAARGMLMPADRQRRLRELQLRRHLAAKDRHVVRHVVAVCVHAADDQVLEHRVAAEGERTHVVAQLADLRKFDPEAAEQLLFPLRRNAALHVVFVAAPGVLVKAAGAHAVAVGVDLQAKVQEPEALQCLMEGLGAFAGDLVADTGDLEQLVLPLAFGLRGLGLGEDGEALSEVQHGLQDDLAGFVEYFPLHVLCGGRLAVRQLFPDLVKQEVDAVVDQLLIADADMAETAGQRGQQERLAGHGLLRGLGDDAQRAVLRRSSLPLQKKLPQHGLVFLGKQESAGGAGAEAVKLLDDPVHGEFRIDRRALGHFRLVADDQLVIGDPDGHFLHDGFKGLRPQKKRRKVLVFFVRTCYDLCAFTAYFRLLRQILCAQAGDPFIQ